MTLASQIKTIIILIILAYLIDCSIYEETIQNAENIVPVAWDLFEDGNYSAAYSKFDEALDIDPNNQEAYHGRAWTALLLSDARDAINDFKAAIYYGNSSLDPLAGLAFAYHADQEYSSAITKAEAVLSSNSNYYFEHKPLINYRDIHLVLAAAYFQTGNLSKTYDHILALGSSVSFSEVADSTYLFNDEYYNSYAELLLAVIDYLDVLYGM